MQERFETTMSPKGQVVISKEIRRELGLKPKQKFIEERRGAEIVLKPVSSLLVARGMLKGMESKPTKMVIREVKKGWQ